MIKIVARNFVKSEEVDNFLKIAQELIDGSRKEVGCISYALWQDLNDENVLTFFEEWRDEKAIEEHNNSKHFKDVVPKLAKLCYKGDEVNLYKEIDN